MLFYCYKRWACFLSVIIVYFAIPFTKAAILFFGFLLFLIRSIYRFHIYHDCDFRLCRCILWIKGWKTPMCQSYLFILELWKQSFRGISTNLVLVVLRQLLNASFVVVRIFFLISTNVFHFDPNESFSFVYHEVYRKR